MRIDLVTTELRVGGAERCLSELAIGLQSVGEQVRVISFDALPLPGPRGGLVDRLRAAQVPLLSLNTHSPKQVVRVYRQLRQIWQQELPDVVQTFLFHANVVGTMAAASVSVPVRIGGIRVAEKKYWRLWLERRASKRMHAMACVSESVAEFTKQHLRPRPSCLVEVIPNSIDTDKAKRAAPEDWSNHGLVTGKSVVLVVGRLNFQKGTDWLAQIAGPLIEQTNAELVVVGEGPLEPAIRSVVERLPQGRGRLLPWSDRVAELMTGARLLLLTSRYEGMPNVVLEAMAAGIPVVATRVEGVRELLGSEGEPQIIEFSDTEGCLRLVQRLLTDSVFHGKMAQNNHLRATNQFSIPRMVGAYQDLYRRILGVYGPVKK